jgi:hypothetical protein
MQKTHHGNHQSALPPRRGAGLSCCMIKQISAVSKYDRSLSRAVSPVDVLKSVLTALTQRNISEAVDL